MHWLKTNKINPGQSGRVDGAMCGDSIFAYRSESDPTKEAPPR
jgi:hypothetical protein